MVMILAFILTIVILVLVHELGHFLAAKKSNIKVLEFGFGLPPRIWGKKWGETLVSINWLLPFGGFVKLLGEDDDSPEMQHQKRSFAAAPVKNRIFVVVAGVAMNLLLAFVLYYMILGFQGFKDRFPLTVPLPSAGLITVDHDFQFGKQTNMDLIYITQVVNDSPAQQAGMKSATQIVAINDQPIATEDQFRQVINQNLGKPVIVKVKDLNGGQEQLLTITPRVNAPPGQGALGIGLVAQKVALIEYSSLGEKLLAGPMHSYNWVNFSFAVLGEVIHKAMSDKNIAPVGDAVSGPVGIAQQLGVIVSARDAILYLNVLALMSLNLALVNILPFPGLDGGRLVFLVYEAITRRRVNPTVEKYIHTAGMMLLLGLIILVTVSDLRKIFVAM